MDYVDLYIYHIWDYKTPAEEIMEGMNDTVRTGKARYIGIANAYAYQVAKMNAMAEQRVRRNVRCSRSATKKTLP